MNDLIFAVNAVFPIILMVAVGYILKRIHMIDMNSAKVMNRLVFKLFLPTMLFLNVYKIENIGSMDFSFVWFGIIFTVCVFFAALPLVRLVTRDRAQMGVLVQGAFRSNYALIGIPLAVSLFGEEGSAVATVLSAFIIPLFNVLAVISLSVFSSEKGSVSIKSTLVEIVKNPLIRGIALGGVMLFIRYLFGLWNIDFRLSDITPVYTVLNYLSQLATPLALIVLGTQFELSLVGRLKKQIIFGTVLRTVVIPAVGLGTAYLMGRFSGAHFAAFVAMLGTPVAVSSVPMAQEMGADSALAGQLVVFTTLFSALSLFLMSYILKAVGIF